MRPPFSEEAYRFQSTLRTLFNIDHDDLVAAGVLDGSERAWQAWRSDPTAQVVRMSDERYAKLWSIIARRQGASNVFQN